MSEDLFSDFGAVDKQTWLSKIEKDAKGKSIADFEWQISSHLTQSPFVRKESLSENYSSIARTKKQNNWWITEPIKLYDLYESNKAIIKALEQGASGLRIFVDSKLDQKGFSEAFKDVTFTYIHTFFEVEDESLIENVISELVDFCKRENQDTNEISGGLRIKNQLVFDGSEWSQKFKDSFQNFSFSYACSDDLFGHKESVIHEVGNLMSACQHLLENNDNHNCIDLDISIGKSYFLNIAKLRAVHLITNNLQKLYQKEHQINLHARLSMQSKDDNENQNLIQFTSQAMSAAVGGVDSMCLPASDGVGLYEGTDFRKRLSRNIQSLMQMESFMNKVADPAAGSYYIESLTDQIAEQSWTYLQNHS